jgi:hypothetical protein
MKMRWNDVWRIFNLVISFCYYHILIKNEMNYFFVKDMSGSFTGAVVTKKVTVMCKGKFHQSKILIESLMAKIYLTNV